MKTKWPDVPEVVRWNKLRHIRRERKLTQAQVAVGAGVSIVTVWYLESGFEERATAETRKKIAVFFEINEGDLFPVDMLGNRPRAEFLNNEIRK